MNGFFLTIKTMKTKKIDNLRKFSGTVLIPVFLKPPIKKIPLNLMM
jgi:hypothetical protein